MSMTRCMMRWGLISGLALGGLTLLVGPQRVATGLAQVRTKAQDIVDQCTDDPIALRHELEKLADEYPERIAEVRGEIAEVDHQIGQFERDIEIANRVVAMTSDDLSELRTLVARAEAESAATARPVSIRYEGVRFDIEGAYNEGRRINSVRSSYKDRLAHDDVQLKFLSEQRTRLGDILAQLEDEYSTYQTQLWQLDRQIDSIQRNERLIELTEAQQATLESYERFGRLDNLGQIQAKLAELRTQQEAQLATLARRGVNHDYEKQAVYELETSDIDGDPFADPFDAGSDDEDADDDEDAETRSSVAFLSPIVIE